MKKIVVKELNKLLRKNVMYDYPTDLDEQVDNIDVKILCPFCNSKFTAEMVSDLDMSEGCESCQFGSGWYGTIEIYCDKCRSLVYKKEVEVER